jgi:hypothetical protein
MSGWNLFMKEFVPVPAGPAWSEYLGTNDWNSAMAQASALGEGWRLPTVLELQTAFSTGIPGGFESLNYWTNEEDPNNTSFAFFVSMYDGSSTSFDKGLPMMSVRAIKP